MRHFILLALAGASFAASAAQAESWDYPESQFHTIDQATYSFTASASEDLTAYFMPSTGSYQSALGVKVNGVTFGRDAMVLGQTDNFTSYDFGHVAKGASIEFFIDVTPRDGSTTYAGTYYSTAADNADHLQHVWTAPHPDQWYLGPNGVPDGTFIGFEDTTTGDPRSDWNYRDYTFVVPGLTVFSGSVNLGHGKPGGGSSSVVTGAVPEPASWATMVLGFGAAGLGLRSRRRGLAHIV
jgi:hypothetical protein